MKELEVTGPAPTTYPATYTGTVASFDHAAGLGVVENSDGLTWLFHCTSIADGSRDIAVDTKVGFEVAAAGPGRWEAHSLAELKA